MYCGAYRYRVAGLLLCICMSACDTRGQSASNTPDSVPGADTGTIGFVLQSYDYLFHKSVDGKEECPNGFALNNEEQWERQFPTEPARKAHLNRCLLQMNRGPDCENVWSNPDVIDDPLPHRSVEGKISYGSNLDGTADGRSTDKTCAHRKFVSHDGKSAIDNQYYRFLGCEKFIRSDVYSDVNARDRTAQYPFNRLLLELRGVNSQVDDDRVDLILYRGKDPLSLNVEGDALPWQTQRIDETIPPVHLRGRISNRMLITAPADVFFEGLFHERRQLVRDMSLRLKLDGVQAEGVRVGYIDMNRLWQSYSRSAKWGGLTYGASPPSAFKALRNLADGYKDPRTGQCTALSSARGYKFVRAYLIHNGNEAK